MMKKSTTMKKIYTALLVGSLTVPIACSDYLDVNTNPNGPEVVSANLYLAPMLHWMVTSPQFEGRFVGRYTQQWTLPGTVLSTWDRMGYDPSSDNGAQQWRDVYWSLGQNLVDMNNLSRTEERWDLLGVGYVLKAWGWLVLTDLHGEIIVEQAIDQSRFAFDYDTQERAYQEVIVLLDSAILNLQRSDGAVSAAYMAKGDRIYAGDRTKWLKYAYGLKAIALNHFTNKASYKPADVIAAVNLSFASNADDALLTYPGVSPGLEDLNFLGWSRNNFRSYRQTTFVVNLMNGTHFGAVDPRMTRMLSPAPDGAYRGLDINVVGGGLTTALTPNNFYGYPTTTLGGASRYIFDDKSKIPAMTYSQLQFVKAEAAYRAGDKALARTAYINGISSHIDFVNARNQDAGQTPTQISAAEKAAFLADVRVVPATPAELTLTHIMSQKYIAQWAWGHNEVWMDMRRYDYTDIDPASGRQVYPGFTPPTNLYPDNGGKIVYRIRPRYNSEYVWNRAGLDVIGGLALDFHTKIPWIFLP
jgi:hypothetical protein